jgi:hypothetical protein
MEEPQNTISESEHLRKLFMENLVISPELAGRIISALEAIANEKHEPWREIDGASRKHYNLSEALLEAYGEYSNRRK